MAYTDPAAGGTAGIYLAGLIERMGIGEEIRNKTIPSRGGRDAAEQVAQGKAEIGVTFISEIIPVKGAKVAGLLPDELQNYTTYTAGIPASNANQAAARQLIAILADARAREHWIAAGFEPVGK